MPPHASMKAGFTALPNWLIDEIMSNIRDTEWRMLCVIVRQTIGWRADGPTGRRQSDWLTQRQLKRRTGRESEALCKAIDALVRNGLIEVRSADGRVLNTPADRRRYAGRQCFRLALDYH